MSDDRCDPEFYTFPVDFIQPAPRQVQLIGNGANRNLEEEKPSC
jgi:hypothetical protein